VPKVNGLSRCLTALDQDSTLIAVIEMSQSSWLVAASVPGIERHPAKKLEPDAAALLRLLHRWQAESERIGRRIERIAVAYEAGRDGVWLARWLRARGVDVQVIHPNSIAVSREHRRAKTDRLDTALLKRAFVGWLRGEPDHCQMIAVPSPEAEDGQAAGPRARGSGWRAHARHQPHQKRPGVARYPRLQTICARRRQGAPLPGNTLAELRRAMVRLQLIVGQIRDIDSARVQQMQQQPNAGAHAMVRTLAQVRGVGLATADLLAHEAFSHPLRDPRAVARYGGLTGAPDESGTRRREKGLTRAGNARVRRAMIQLAWRFLIFQKDSALARWYWQRPPITAARPAKP
jgi:transposase